MSSIDCEITERRLTQTTIDKFFTNPVKNLSQQSSRIKMQNHKRKMSSRRQSTCSSSNESTAVLSITESRRLFVEILSEDEDQQNAPTPAKRKRVYKPRAAAGTKNNNTPKPRTKKNEKASEKVQNETAVSELNESEILVLPPKKTRRGRKKLSEISHNSYLSSASQRNANSSTLASAVPEQQESSSASTEHQNCTTPKKSAWRPFITTSTPLLHSNSAADKFVCTDFSTTAPEFLTVAVNPQLMGSTKNVTSVVSESGCTSGAQNSFHEQTTIINSPGPSVQSVSVVSEVSANSMALMSTSENSTILHQTLKKSTEQSTIVISKDPSSSSGSSTIILSSPHKRLGSLERNAGSSSASETSGGVSKVQSPKKAPNSPRKIAISPSNSSPKKINVVQNIVLKSPKRRERSRFLIRASSVSTEASTSTGTNRSPSRSPKKNSKPTSGTTNTGSPTGSPVKAEQKLNFRNLDVLNTFLKRILSSNQLKCLLKDDDKDVLLKFFTMDRKYQYLCIKLFTWQPIWYNVFKYAQQIKLDMAEKEIFEMYSHLKDDQLVDTDYSKENLGVLLNLIELKELKDIQKKFKLASVRSVKDNIIGGLLKMCTTQNTLGLKPMDEVLRNMIKKKMGLCIRMSDRIRECFYRIFLLNTFANSNYLTPQDYFSQIGRMDIVYPKYKVEEFSVFYTRDEFESYVDAVKCRVEIDKAIQNKNLAQAMECCSLAFERLQKILSKDNACTETPRPEYLEKFTAKAKYISVLAMGAKFLTTEYFADVKQWIDYVIAQNCCRHKRGFWYNQLLLIETVYLKQHQKAAERLIEIMSNERDSFSEIELHKLANRGRLLNKKTYKVDQLYHDKIVELSPPSCDREWPSIVIDRQTVRGNQSGYKRLYVTQDDEGTRTFMGVEQMALDHYLSTDYNNGRHFEGSIIIALFCLSFWDIIYDHYVEGVFICDIQEAPLDMNSRHFYLNRKQAIDQRLQEISHKWTKEELNKFLTDNHTQHSHEATLCNIEGIEPNAETLCTIAECIGREALSKIFRRLVTNYYEHRSGFPDLLVWNTETKTCKFVEVKGENDVLSIKQKLWLQYLMDSGVPVEVCHVHSIGSKKKKKLEKKSSE